MLAGYKARKAFEECPNRTIATPTGEQDKTLVCPKYPEGVEVKSQYGGGSLDSASRRTIALQLGCASCMFSETPYQMVEDLGISPDGTAVTTRTFQPLESVPPQVVAVQIAPAAGPEAAPQG